MAKKSIWIDNTRPPINYIWAKTDSAGNIVGVYQWSGNEWLRIANEISGGGSTLKGDGIIKAYTLEGEEIEVAYSMSQNPGTVVVRTESGTILSKTPKGDNLQEVVTVEMLSWGD